MSYACSFTHSINTSQIAPPISSYKYWAIHCTVYKNLNKGNILCSTTGVGVTQWHFAKKKKKSDIITPFS